MWSYFDVFVHPRLSGSLQAVRHDIFRLKTFANSFLTMLYVGQVKNFQVRSVGRFLEV